MNHLLPAQTLLDLCAQDVNAAQRWARDIDTSTLRLSVISVAQARAAVMRLDDHEERIRLDAALNSLVATIEADGGPALPFDSSHCHIWSALMHDPRLTGLSQIDRQVHAQAMHEGLSVVERPQATTAELQTLGARITVLT